MFTLCNNLLFAFYNEIKDVICMYRYVLFMERMGENKFGSEMFKVVLPNY